MSRKLVGPVVAIVAVMIFCAMSFDYVAFASSHEAGTAKRVKPSGLTAEGLASARKDADRKPTLKAMIPQSDFVLLKQATRLSRHDPTAFMHLSIGLRLNHVRALKKFLQAVQNPHSPQYHHFLTPSEFTAKYGPTKKQVDAVRAFLGAKGIEVTGVSPNRLLVRTKATTAKYEHAFGIRINDYRLNGRRFFSTEASPMLPRALTPIVANVIGLNNAVQLHPHSHFSSNPIEKKTAENPGIVLAPPPPSTTYFVPSQIAAAYDWPSLTDAANGAGVTTAIITSESSDISASDYEGFWSAFGLPDHSVRLVPIDGGGGYDSTGHAEVETLLDIEWCGGMSPGESLIVYVATYPSLVDFTDAYNRLVTDNAAQVMTTSWGHPESTSPGSDLTDEAIFMEAAAQGISMFAASGDNGSSDGTAKSNMADYPSSSAYITAAGGTALRADIHGNYLSESAWGDASGATGGAVSETFAEPIWQTGPGVPQNGWRTTSDMAMNASGQRPYVVYEDGKWIHVWGTSAVAPQLAGMFAIAVSKGNGIRLGQSNRLIYDDVNAKNYASDFRDVTKGSNGAYSAVVNWDYPTGWGSPRATSLISHLGIQGPRGILSGTVTNAANDKPVGGAKVTVYPGAHVMLTDADGHYSFLLPAGGGSVVVSDFGYITNGVAVTVSDGGTTTKDIALQSLPTAKITGRVSDGSGHGYGLYAEIKISVANVGEVADLWTNPATGAYSVTLPESYSYMLAVTPTFRGYNAGSAAVGSLEGNITKNFSIPVVSACKAPGYRFAGMSADFNGVFPPTGWSVVNDGASTTATWNTTSYWSQNGWHSAANWTGGTGDTAAGYAPSYYPPPGSFSTSLISPPIALSSIAGNPVLLYKANYQHEFGDSLDLDISVDGGPWTTITHWMTNHGKLYNLPGENESVNLAPYLSSGAKQFWLRWHYYDPSYSWGWYAEVDDVAIGSCQPVSGGLVLGQVTDANTGKGIVGASISDDQGDGIQTIENPDDPSLPVGTYLFFVPSGQRSLTASRHLYADDTADFPLRSNAVKTQDFALKTGRLSAKPSSVPLHVMVGQRKTERLMISNTGTGRTHFQLLSINAPASRTASRSSASLAWVSVRESRPGLDALAARPLTSSVSTERARLLSQDESSYTAGAVVGTFALPAYTVLGLGVDRNAGDLWIGNPAYAGYRGDNADHRVLFDGEYTGDAIDVASSKISYMADMAFDDNIGMLWQLSVDAPDGYASHIIEIDPKTMKLTGENILVPSPQSERGLAYDPTTDTWYAGGFVSQRGHRSTGSIYHFDSSGKLLNHVTGLNIPVEGLAYNSYTGHLFVLPTSPVYPPLLEHSVYILDPANDYALVGTLDIPGFDPNLALAGPGMDYDCNGHLWISDMVDHEVWEVNSGESGWCAVKHIPWLTLAPGSGTVAQGADSQVTLTVDGTGQKPFTTSQAHLELIGDTPYPAPAIPIIVHWDPQSVELVVTGEASPDLVQKGGNLTYTLTVQNKKAVDHGAATETTLTYKLPDGVSYVASSGDARCSTPAAGSSPASAAATAGPPLGTVTCDFGTLVQGASKTITIAVKAEQAGKLTSHFEVAAREPDEADKNALDLITTVIGDADLGTGAKNATLTQGSTGTLHLAVANAGPDPATEVKLKLSAGANVKLQSAKSGQGQCGLAGGDIECDLGEIAADRQVDVEVSVFGINVGSAQVTAQATTAADDTDTANNVATAQVTVKAASNGGGGNNGGGGGALGWLALVTLLAVSTLKCRWR